MIEGEQGCKGPCVARKLHLVQLEASDNSCKVNK